MKITLRSKEGRRQVSTIYLDDDPYIDVHAKIFGKDFSFTECVSEEDFKEKFRDLEFAKAKNYALNCLAMRSYPSTQLQKLLIRHFVSLETIEKIIKEFISLGYLNDEEWIERFIQSQLKRHIGPQVILFKLMNKGIPQKKAQSYLDLLLKNSDTRASIEHLIKTKYKKRDFSDFKEKQKVFASLMRKGFDAEDVRTVIH